MTQPTRTVPNPASEPTISVKRAAAILNISLRHAYYAIERNEIPAIRVGQKITIPTARFLAKFQLNADARDVGTAA